MKAASKDEAKHTANNDFPQVRNCISPSVRLYHVMIRVPLCGKISPIQILEDRNLSTLLIEMKNPENSDQVNSCSSLPTKETLMFFFSKQN